MENKQTAVEWLIIQIKNDHIDKALTGLEWMRIFQQAKQMEKEQSERMYSEEDLKEAFVAGEKHNQWSFSCPSFNEWFEQLKKKSYDQKTNRITNPHSMG